MIEKVYTFLWGDLIRIPLPGGSTLGISLLILLLIPTGIYFTIRTKLLPIRLFPDMVRALSEKKSDKNNLSAFQTLIVSTATRVGMGNPGRCGSCDLGRRCRSGILDVDHGADRFLHCFYRSDPGTALERKGSSIWWLQGRSCLLYPPLLGRKTGQKTKKGSAFSVLFAISGLICWCGISQVISNSVTASFKKMLFDIPPLYTTIVLVVIAAVIVLRKNATVKVLDLLVPVMAVLYFVITLFIIFHKSWKYAGSI